MKQISIILILFSISIYGQIKPKKLSGLIISNQEVISKKDTIIRVFYKSKNKNNPAILLNGMLINSNILKSINPNEIVNVKVEKENIEVNNVKYYGKILIETKDNYKPRLISLNDLKSKYTNLKKSVVIYQIDDEIVDEDYNTYLIDENYILSMVIENIENQNEKMKFNFIKLLTKSDENIKKSKEIRIRGKNEFALNK